MRTLTLCLFVLCLPSLGWGAMGARLTWTITDPQNLTAYFLVFRSVTGSTLDFANIARTTKETRGYLDPNLVAGVTYFYTVRACNEGGCSPQSDTMNITMPAAPPLPAVPANVRVVE